MGFTHARACVSGSENWGPAPPAAVPALDDALFFVFCFFVLQTPCTVTQSFRRTNEAGPRAPGVRQTHAFRAALPACRPPSRPAYSHGLCHAPCTGLSATSVQETPAAPCVCRPKGHGAASGWGGGGERDSGSWAAASHAAGLPASLTALRVPFPAAPSGLEGLAMAPLGLTGTAGVGHEAAPGGRRASLV